MGQFFAGLLRITLNHGWYSLCHGTEKFPGQKLHRNKIIVIVNLTCWCLESCGYFGSERECFPYYQRWKNHLTSILPFPSQWNNDYHVAVLCSPAVLLSL